MKKILTACLLTASLFGVSPASFSSDADDVTAYFDKHKIGRGADYGIFKNDTDHVVTVHGFVSDLEVCIEIVTMLNKEQPDKYSCKPLNH
jgi:hypothetical protein